MGLGVAAQPMNLAYCFLGVFLGTLVGVLPGIGALAAISLLLPGHLPHPRRPRRSSSRWRASTMARNTAARPPPSCWISPRDAIIGRHLSRWLSAMAKNGRAGLAPVRHHHRLAWSAPWWAWCCWCFFRRPSPSSASSSARPRFFSMMLLGLVAASSMSGGSAAKGLATVVLGLLLGTIGTDVGNSGTARYDFDIPELQDGINLVALAMGLFGVAEVVRSIEFGRHPTSSPTRCRCGRWCRPDRSSAPRSSPCCAARRWARRCWGAAGRRALDRRLHGLCDREAGRTKDPGRFGQGAIEGISAPESANNASAQTAFVPSLSLGIPGDAVMAVMLGALIIHGIAPGPMLIQPAARALLGFGGQLPDRQRDAGDPEPADHRALGGAAARSLRLDVPGHPGLRRPRRVQRQQQSLRHLHGGCAGRAGLCVDGAEIRAGTLAAGATSSVTMLEENLRRGLLLSLAAIHLDLHRAPDPAPRCWP